jgi:putative Mg2+ transporter-C (MgtC) family protein
MSPPSTLETIGRILLAVFLSGIVGLEREAKGRAAGLRTHILVSVGSTLIMLLGLYLGGSDQTDPTRLAAQVVSGIGFLGAGTILQSRDSIRGLTTAASLWASAGIGLAVGAGFYLGAVWTTGVVLATLILLSFVERRMGPKGGG